jgi:hypothetical protein
MRVRAKGQIANKRVEACRKFFFPDRWRSRPER